ncbi:tripartite tricarboxylate transporter substrate binding protein [Variovorax guangxiensis]|uniref:Bug family tripartite tricarboxylate transporter substrate binding protein n=1 Tax=Variovorax guangxiensis TaxID=1775474 RepID=UPI00285D6524|nr:tripartite tricarboxylate transporter substrate binding protein [Variovorax guangxiensis]MDR6855620.1 tripartite-type tricarboxylate transporter receptor subunit TctC [Variovorax guangxiensis]
MRRRRFVAAGLTLACAAPIMASAQDFPDKPIKIYQGFAAGGNADTIARVVSAEMSKGLGQPFVVEAQTGAGGTIAATTVARARPDGYTLLLATGGHAVAGALYNKLSYQTVSDFQMISTVTFFPFLLVVRADSPYRSLAELLAAARADGRSVSYGSAGIGSTHHLAGELLVKSAKAELLHVPYRGDAAAVTALLGGEVPLIVAPPTAVMANIKAGKLRALATTGAQRWSVMPEVPTVVEQGVPGYDVRSWAGFMAPAGTPRPVVERLRAETLKALQVAAVRARLEDMGGEARGSTPEEMTTMVSAELKRWTAVVNDAHIPRQ